MEENKSFVVSILDGSGTAQVSNGTYNVTATASGYDNTSILPKSTTITDDVDTYDFTIAATGNLTIHVTEDGTSGGNPVQNAVFYRCDSSGTTYGDPITTDQTGTAVLANVPFVSDTGITIYYKQTATDNLHNFDNTLQNISMTGEAQTVEITNPLAETKTFNLKDANYDGLVINSAQITLTD